MSNPAKSILMIAALAVLVPLSLYYRSELPKEQGAQMDKCRSAPSVISFPPEAAKECMQKAGYEFDASTLQCFLTTDKHESYFENALCYRRS